MALMCQNHRFDLFLSFSVLIFWCMQDPLIKYRWTKRVDDALLQIYSLQPRKASSTTPASFSNLDSLIQKQANATVSGPGTIVLDFGVESAAWLEFDSPDMAAANPSVQLSISEYNQPAIVNSGPVHPIKTDVPKRYGNSYRLELNKELYEGVRFGAFVRDFVIMFV